MPFIEKFRQKQNEAAAAGTPPEQEPKGPPLKEILANSEQSRLFGMYLEEQRETDLAKKLVEGNLRGGELDALSEQRKGFLRMREQVKTLEGQLDRKSVEEIIASSDELQKISELVGPEAIRDAVLKNLSEMAIREPEQFESMKSASDVLQKTKESITEENKNIEDLCKKYGVTEDDYMEALEKNDSKAVEDLMRGKIGAFSKLHAKFSKKYAASLRSELAAANKGDVIKERIAALEGDMRSLGGAMRGALVGNNKVRSALVKNLRQETSGQREEPPATFSEVSKSILDISLSKTSDADFEKAWKDYQEKHSGDTEYSAETAKVKFLSEYLSSKMPKKNGFWAEIGKLFLFSAIEQVLGKK